MECPVSPSYRLGGKLKRQLKSRRKIKVNWDLCEESSYTRVKSEDFSFAGATWNFFASFDEDRTHSQFGIWVRTQSSSDEAFDCDISFVYNTLTDSVKHIEGKFIFQKSKSYWEVTDFLSSSEIQRFLSGRREIHCLISELNCLISVKSIKDACSQTEDSHSLESENKDILVGSIDCEVCQDFKNLLLSGEGSDVTLKVQDQEFKAHRLLITARSSVFAAMFLHDMKEKATGVVNVEDCEPSYFPVLLEFLYCGSTEKLSVENVFSLYTSSDKYDIKGLKIKCLEFIKNNLSVETFCDTARLSLQHSEADLLKLTTDFFTRNLKKIIITVKWLTFAAENPVQSNEFFIKALVSDVKDD